MTHGAVPPEMRAALGIVVPRTLSVGVEDVNDLIDDLRTAFAEINLDGKQFRSAFRMTTWGESHGGGVGVVIDGCPAGVEISETDIQRDLDRRRPGQSKIVTQRDEADRCEILSGRFRRTNSRHTDFHSRAQQGCTSGSVHGNCGKRFRPSHADFTYEANTESEIGRAGVGLPRRETIGRVAAGAVARKVLEKLVPQLEIVAYVKQIHEIAAVA